MLLKLHQILLDDDPIYPQFLPLTHRRIRRTHSNDLLYWSQSPDYCHNKNSIFVVVIIL
jgi:hypothetical protein